ncbi:hypothetical protein, partial [Polaribacter sargassicola]|uniref:hypothetical protein n=1 Tax=Polaribacter sargassicola TaxID=2836891 RepID=UPI001F3FAF3F
SNGQMLSQIVKNNLDQELKTTNQTFDSYINPVSGADEIMGLVHNFNPFIEYSPNSYGLKRFQFYRLKTQWWYKESETQTTYDTEGNNPFVTS